MSVKRTLGYWAGAGLTIILVGFTGLTVFTQVARDAATAHIEKPDAVRRLEGRVPVQARAAVEKRAPSNTAAETEMDPPGAEPNVSYVELAERMRSVWEGLEPELRISLMSLADTHLTPEQCRSLLDIIAANPGLIEQIWQTARQAGAVASLDLSHGFSLTRAMEAALVSRLARCAQFLNAHARASAEDGDAETAVKDILAALRLAGALTGEPLPNSQFAAHHVYALSLDAYRTCLEAGALDPRAARSVLDELAAAHHRQALLDTLDTWRYLGNMFYEDLDHMTTHDFLRQHLEGDADEIGTNAVTWLIGSPLGQPWVNMNAAATAETVDSLRQLAEMPFHESLTEAVRLLDERVMSAPMLERPSACLFEFPAIRALSEQAVHETRVDLARVGIALDLYRAENGHYPATLDLLAPLLGGSVPNDSLSGEPFLYSTDGTAFDLASMGFDDRLSAADYLRQLDDDLTWNGGGQRKKSNV